MKHTITIVLPVFKIPEKKALLAKTTSPPLLQSWPLEIALSYDIEFEKMDTTRPHTYSL